MNILSRLLAVIMFASQPFSAPLAASAPAPVPVVAQAAAPASHAQQSQPLAGSDAAGLRDFQLVAPGRGWVLLGQQLFWTDDGGQAWRDITPPALGQSALQAAAFSTSQDGWVALGAPGADGLFSFQLSHTTDGGNSWQTRPLSLFDPGDPHALAGALHLQMLDARTGWLVVKRATSRNFSLGALFFTADGGQTWERHSLPIGEPVHFESASAGWTAGGAAGDELYRTTDGGRTWQAQSLPAGAALQAYHALPFDEPLLPTDLAAGITQLDMAGAHGWARHAEGECAPAPPPVPEDGGQLLCTTHTRLLATADGGHTWQALSLPQAAGVSAAAAPMAVVAGQGFDSCTKPTLDQMLTWMGSSPYRTWNLYIGGSARANCGTLTQSFIESLAGQGWTLIPTWVGPQAACSDFGSRMSGDPAIANQQGRNEADLAIARAASLGLLPPNTDVGIIYYDLEAYTPDSTEPECREASKQFISGWTERLRQHNYRAAVYGSPCTSYLADFVSISHVPDAVWVAAWLRPYQYRPDASVFFPVPSAAENCVSNSLWVNQQRLRQYSGGHNQTWGGVTINIDSNVLDGIVTRVLNPCPQADGVTVYWHANFGCSSGTDDLGYRQRTTPGWQNLDGQFNDQASSLRVPTGWSVMLYEHSDRTGVSICYNTNVTNFGEQGNYPGSGTPINDSATSMEVFNNPHCARDWVQTYYNSPQLSSPCGVTSDSGIYLFRDTAAGWGPPPGCPGAHDAWSARLLRGQAWFDGGDYEFGLFYDDGARLFLDGVLIIDGWGPNLQSYASRNVTRGAHQVMVEYRNDGGPGRVDMWWRGPGAVPMPQAQNPGQWWVSYWGNRHQAGHPVTSLNEGAGFLARNWGSNGPGFHLPSDHFSTRFERSVAFNCGVYNFSILSDDGSRLHINGTPQPAFDHWADGVWHTVAPVALITGTHTLRVDHFEYAGGASLHFSWNQVGPCLTERTYFPVIGQ